MQARFTSKVNLPSVNQNTGVVESNKFPLFKNWSSETTMEKMLTGLYNEMIANKKAPQPPDGDMF
jgi:ubiquitin-conjugating enzyme E2 variant